MVMDNMSLKKLFSILNPTFRDNFLESSPPESPETGVGVGGSVRVVGLYVFPVKSCGGSSLSSSRVSRAGLEFDRQWMVMRGRTVLTQAREPRLAQIKARVELARRVLVLSCPGLQDIEAEWTTDSSPPRLTPALLCHKDTVKVIFCPSLCL